MKKHLKYFALSTFFTMFLCVEQSYAASIVINVTPTSTGTCTTPDYVCSLQQALTLAETGTDDFTINLAAGTYSDAYTFTSDQNKTVSLAGAGVDQTILDPSTNSSINLNININSGATLNLAFSNLTISGGQGLSISSFPLSPGSVSLSSVKVSNDALSSNSGLYTNTSGPVTISNSIFSDNAVTGTSNGAAVQIRAQTGNILISNSTFENNTTPSSGGAGYLETTSGSIVLLNNLILHNTSTGPGNNAGGFLVSATSGTITFTNNTVYNNSAVSTGGAIEIGITSSNINFYNNIFNSNNGSSGDDIVIDYTGGTVINTNIFNNNISEICTNVLAACGLDQFGSNQGQNTNEDPQFNNAAEGNFTLLSASALIDAGSASAPSLPSTDITGVSPRNFGLAPDMGAYEAIPQLSVSPSSINFATVSSPQTITITNNGNYPASVSSIALSDTTNFILNTSGSGACGGSSATIAAGSNCTVQVASFNQSTSTTTGTLTITSNDPANATLTVSLSEAGGSGGGGCSFTPHGTQNSALILLIFLSNLLFYRIKTHQVRN